MINNIYPKIVLKKHQHNFCVKIFHNFLVKLFQTFYLYPVNKTIAPGQGSYKLCNPSKKYQDMSNLNTLFVFSKFEKRKTADQKHFEKTNMQLLTDFKNFVPVCFKNLH